MAEITASMVKELREKTDAPMMECKKALSETGGDLKQAEELLRIKLGNKASRAASRVAADGLVAARIEGGVGALVEVNSETDFVARNQEFADFVGELAALVVRTGPADLDALRLTRVDGRSVEEMRTALIGRLGENLAIRRFVRYQSTERLASYLHGTRIGVLVDYSADDGQVGKDLAMHIAASRPL